MGNENNGFVGHAPKIREELLSRCFIQGAGGLVQHEDGIPGEYRPGGGQEALAGIQGVQAHEQLENGAFAAAGGAGENAVAAETDAQKVRTVHQPRKAHIADVGESIPLEPGSLVVFHPLPGLVGGLFLPAEAADDQQTFQPLLQIHPQGAVGLLNSLMEAFQNLAEGIGQNEHTCAAGHQNIQKSQ